MTKIQKQKDEIINKIYGIYGDLRKQQEFLNEEINKTILDKYEKFSKKQLQDAYDIIFNAYLKQQNKLYDDNFK